MQLTKNDIKGIAGTIVFHLLLLLLFYFFGYTSPRPIPEDEGGIEVNLGNSNQGMGEIQPDSPSESAAQPTPSSSSDNDYATQNTEETPAFNVKKNTNKTPSENPTKAPITPVEPQKPTVNTSAVYSGKKNSVGGNQGTTGQPGDQGQLNGTPKGTSYTGSGTSGNVNYSLSGRSAKFLAKPTSNFTTSGIVVVEIWVDQTGKVTRANTGVKGSTTTNQNLLNLAYDAAMRTSFSPDEEAATEQRGTITYHFVLHP